MAVASVEMCGCQKGSERSRRPRSMSSIRVYIGVADMVFVWPAASAMEPASLIGRPRFGQNADTADIAHFLPPRR